MSRREIHNDAASGAFVLYRLPESDAPTLLRQGDGEGKLRFVVSPFLESTDHPTAVISNDRAEHGWQALQGISDTTLTAMPQVHHDYHSHYSTFHRELHDGRFQKLVLSHPFVTEPVLDAAEMFRTLCQHYPHSLVYLLSTPQTGTWIGATPELLLSGIGTHLRTMALAGTKADEDTEWDPKNRMEQEMVSRFIRESLEGVGDNISESAPHDMHTGNLWHLQTDFLFQPVEGVGISDILCRLHPTPAVCGLPQTEARQFILDHEGYDRSYYSGYLGPISESGEVNIYVNIRCAQLFCDAAIAYAGSGMLTDSTLDGEWQEVCRKSMALGLGIKQQ